MTATPEQEWLYDVDMSLRVFYILLADLHALQLQWPLQSSCGN